MLSRGILASAAVTAACLANVADVSAATKGTMLLNRVGPVTSELYVANADGSNEHKLLPTPGFDYHAAWSADGKWIVFTSERDGLGQSELYRVKTDGTGLQRLTNHIAIDDAAVFSPVDADTIAFVSSRSGANSWATANVWTLKISTGALKNVTGDIPFDANKPHSYFRPSFSPDGKWIALSSDIGSDWRGHNLPVGWERTQESSIYVVHPDGTGFHKVASNPGFDEGSPTFAPDGKSIVFYETPVEATWGAHRPELINTIVSQLVQVDLADGSKKTLTSTPGLKVFPQFLSATNIAYHVKGGATEGLYTTDGKFRATPNSGIRSPRYSPDGTTVIYEKVSFRPATKNGTPLFSFDADWNYRYTDVFPQLSADRKQLVYTEKAVGSSIAVMNIDFSGYKRIYDPMTSGLPQDMLMKGLAGAFQPTWSPNREWVAFGVGQWFFTRGMGKGTIMRIKADGSMNGKPEPLTDGSTNAGFPSYSPDGKKLVYRVYSNEAKGLRILDIESRQSTVLTTELDNVPGWSPDGQRIVFTRKLLIDSKDPNKFNYDVFTIKPDGTDLKRLTSGPSNDAHATWTWDGRIAYNSGNYGFRDELALYDNSFQPDGQNWVMNADGSNPHAITDTLWEEAMPLFIPND